MFNEAKKKIFSEIIEFQGHRNIIGTHYNTLEITTHDEISKRADCIVGVSATKGCSGLNPKLSNHVKNNGKMSFVIRVENEEFTFFGFGDPALKLTNPLEIVLRKSVFASDRTLAVRCNAAAIDLPRSMVHALQDPSSRGSMEIIALDEYAKEQIPTVEFV